MQLWLPVPVLLYQMLLSHLLFRSTMSLPDGLPSLWLMVTMLLPFFLSITMPAFVLAGAPEFTMRFCSLRSLPVHFAVPQPSRMPVSPFPLVPLQSVITLRDEPNSQMPYLPLPAAVAVEIVPSSEL